MSLVLVTLLAVMSGTDALIVEYWVFLWKLG
jgi:hypothetical protein